MGFATAVSPGWGNLVAEVEDAPRAFVPRSHRGVALSTEHSQGGDTLSTAALRDGRLKCCRLPCVELTTKGEQKQEEKSKRPRMKTRIKRETECACD